MTPFLIDSEAAYLRAIELVRALLHAPVGTPEAQTLEVMSLRVQEFEAAELADVLPPADLRVVIAAKLNELA